MYQPVATVRPKADEYFEYYDTYISKVPDGDVLELLKSQVIELKEFFASVPESESTRLHAPYTWTIKQVVGHLIDAERIFADRLHRFAMGDPQPQPGMDQDIYVAGGNYDSVALPALVEEFCLCRRANCLLIARLPEQAWDHRGVASGYEVTVRALAWMMAGHVIHHMRIVHKRLGTPA